MAWVADPDVKRTYDESSGLELTLVSGGSDGGKCFSIHPIGRPDTPIGGFYARKAFRPLTQPEQKERPDEEEVAIWQIRSGWGKGIPFDGYSSTESKRIIQEAMIAFRGGHGAPKRFAWPSYEVKFGL